ncbi:hypothetical protein BH23GEM9_BH23GEM9_37610 [soil metagenome]
MTETTMCTLMRAALLQCLAVTVTCVAATAQTPVTQGKPAEWQIASAVLALPEPLRAHAEVRGWSGDALVTLRTGTNGIICLADRTEQEGFAAACYHDSLEPFMERGRELTRQGVAGAERDETRWHEIEAGTLPMPAMAMVYNLRHSTDDFDPATFDPATAARLHAFYIRGATPESTGVSALPSAEPWLMSPGTPTAHIMIAIPARPAVERR